MELLILIMICIGLAHIVGGIVGFGSSLLAVACIAMIDSANAIKLWLPVMAICGLIQASMIIVQSHKDIDYKSLIYIIIFAPLGLPLGYLLLTQLDSQLITLLLGSLLILGGILPLLRDFSGKSIPAPARAITLFLVGIIHGGFASGGTLLIPYARITITEKDAFRATLACTWLTLNGGLLAFILIKGDRIVLATPAVITTCVVVVATTLIGQFIATKIDTQRFAIVASTCMVIAGLIYIGQQFI